MRVFVGIPLSEIESIRDRLHQHALIQECLRPSRLEGHITLKAPQTIADTKDWVKAVKAAVAGFETFDVTLTNTLFITPFTLALAVSAPVALYRLCHHLASELAPYNSEPPTHEGEDFLPHLTIGRSTKLISPTERTAILQLCRSQLPLPDTRKARMVRLYGREDQALEYEIVEDIPLNGSS
jgi:2'-5' RNA ligase